MSALMKNNGFTVSNGLVALRDIVSDDRKRLADGGRKSPAKNGGAETCVIRVVSMAAADVTE